MQRILIRLRAFFVKYPFQAIAVFLFAGIILIRIWLILSGGFQPLTEAERLRQYVNATFPQGSPQRVYWDKVLEGGIAETYEVYDEPTAMERGINLTGFFNRLPHVAEDYYIYRKPSGQVFVEYLDDFGYQRAALFLKSYAVPEDYYLLEWKQVKILPGEGQD